MLNYLSITTDSISTTQKIAKDVSVFLFWMAVSPCDRPIRDYVSPTMRERGARKNKKNALPKIQKSAVL